MRSALHLLLLLVLTIFASQVCPMMAVPATPCQYDAGFVENTEPGQQNYAYDNIGNLQHYGVEAITSSQEEKTQIRSFFSFIDGFFVARWGVGPVRIGQAAEAAIQSVTGLAKNTQSFVVNGRNRIPDFVRVRDPVTGLPSQVIESKNVASQAFTRQLRDLRDLVGPTGRVDVALPPGARVRVTRPLQEAFDNPRNPLFRVDIPQ